jgi:hypothetical protein
MPADPSLPPEPLPLTEASVQEIQLELIRRRRFNQFDGPRIVASLRRHRSLWRAVLMDRLGHVSEHEGRQTVSDLIKLRDLSENCWNVDDMYILTDTLDQAQELQRIQEEEQWLADNVTVIENQQELSRALGSFPASGFIVSFWWD